MCETYRRRDRGYRRENAPIFTDRVYDTRANGSAPHPETGETAFSSRSATGSSIAVRITK